MNRIILILMVSFSVSAKDIYIAQTAAGADDGSSCANAKSMAWFLTAGNWDGNTGSPTKVSYFDTAHLCGTITSQMAFTGGVPFGYAITILFESNAVMESGVWTGTGAIYAQNRASLIVDGGANGVIRCTNSGSPDTALTSTNGSAPAVSFDSGYLLEVKNLTVSNIYVRKKGPWLQGASGIYFEDAAGFGLHDITVSNCVISHCTIGIGISYGPGNYNFLFTENTISNVNWGAGGGDRNSSSVLTNITFSNNRVWAFTNWDGTELDALLGARGAYHHNGCYFWAESGGTLKEVNIFGNHVGPAFSTQTDGSSQATAAYFVSGNCSGPLSVYNNVAEQEGGVDFPGNGFIALGGTGTNRVSNNTFLSKAPAAVYSIQINGAGGNVQGFVNNNIITNMGAIWVKSWTAGDNLTADNNVGFSLPAAAEYSVSATSSSSDINLEAWQALGYDTHGTNLNPLLTSTYRLNAGSPAIGYGAVLNSFFTTDYDGVTRGSVWDAGAFEFVAPDLTRTVNVSGTLRVGTMTVP